MASAGPRITGTAANVDRAGNTAWATPTNAQANDGTTTDAAVPTDYLVCTNFGFTIPDGASIHGIVVSVECHETGSGSSNYTAQLITDATPTLVGSSKTSGTVSGTTPTVYDTGTTSDVWGATLTPTVVNATGFGVAVWSTDTTNTLLVDYVAITITYTEGPLTGALVLTGNAPTVSAVAAGTNVNTATGTTTITGQVPTVTQQNGYTTGVGTLAVTGQAPALTKQENVFAATGTLSFGSTAPTISTSAAPDRMRVSWLALKLPASTNPNVYPAVGALTFTGNAPAVTTSTSVSTDVGALVFSGQSPTVSTVESVNVNAVTGLLAFTGQAPAITEQIGVSSSTGTLSLTGVAPTVTEQVGTSPSTGTLAITGQVPTVSEQINAGTATGTLAITGQSPAITEQIGVTTAVGSLVFTGITPAVSVLSPGAFEPQTATLTLVGQEPTVSAQQKVSTDVGSVVLAGQAPSVSTGILVNTATGSIVLAGYAPTADTLLNILPGTGQIVLEGYAPTVAGGESIPEETRGQQPAGRPSRSRRRRKPVLVEIDGQQFVVRSEAEAAELIDKAEEAARQVAEEQAKEIVAKRTKKARKAPLNTSPLRLAEPVITVRPLNDGTIDPEWIRTVQAEADRISEAFRAVAQQYETAILLNHRLQLDEEDALVALLLTI